MYTSLLLAAWRGLEPEASDLIATGVRDAAARGEGRAVGLADHATAVLHNGLGRYDEALAAARRACEHDDLGFYGWSLAELVEAGGPERRARGGRRRPAPARGADAVPAARTGHAASRRDRAHSWPTTTAPNPLPGGHRAARPHAAWSCTWPARTWCTASGCAARTAASTRASSSAPRTRCSAGWGRRRSRSAHGASCWPPARRCADAARRHETSSRPRRRRSRAWRRTATRTRRSARSCSSARAPSSTTCARCS